MSDTKEIVLVTGGRGLVGEGIKAALKEEGYSRPNEEFVFLGRADGDLTKLADTKAVFAKYKPTYVLHLAAKVGGLFSNMKYKVEFFRDNLAINDNVLWCCKEFEVKKCVSCMSTCIFPDKTTYPIDETMVHNGPPHTSNEGYAYAKRFIDVMNRCYKEEYDCNFTSVIPTNIYGPHDNYHLHDSHVIPGLIHKCYIAMQNDTDFTIWGSGTPLRQFIYSVDLGKLFLWTMREYNELDPIILSVGESDEVSIKDVALLIAEAMEFKGKVVFDTEKADGQFKKTASNEKLVKLNPEFKFTTMAEGLRQSCQWFKDNFDTARK
eukprot:TRINITY_DN12721_c0_g1_i1.p1 TRINITY_DN12721_c0_g1~~TRINITY_DN12721_c0_g1_i1.p1  ORF type:complete len:339 (-),score=102.56 TRINITY_DN12721_c0_g1_i1:104-1066(-)